MLQIVVACEGVLAVCLCAGFFVYFARSQYQIGRAVGYDKLAEGFLSAMTLVFSLLVDGVWDFPLSPPTMAIMRAAMFGASIACSVHLFVATRRVVAEKEQRRDNRTDASRSD